ncbi:Zn-dependent exopeptidase [Dothidotthia symphoricarpi CBS 119687]|uniref:Peptide hydrolase n=1 Tax=Dothidotthia symphoricarpi CBS 119687 TaxID=1392245 RepID=A0A6A6AC25_9PLEO|nr:Zn-dependent exopeptidase [Dothidotthia symphoricarpi CBS 119687]KAF2129136.1 Zn-dependent exopeptidase [Dothidotthia symphoricarpi CBS 119687]
MLTCHQKGLKKAITQKVLKKGSQKLQDIAYSYPERNRVMGSPGHNDTVNWLKAELESLDGYYDVELQEFWSYVMLSGEINKFAVGNNSNVTASIFDYSASGNATASLVAVNDLGCEASDYPAAVAGNIALISRGSCEFGLKSALAGSAGAVGAVIYNNVAGNLQATLGAPPRPEGEYVASVGVSLETGSAWVAALAGGANLTATLDVTTDVRNISTYNVLATTKCGDHDNRLAVGAHTDSVVGGPGINDDGSGTVGILSVAKALAKYRVNNAVTFGFWSGEESGLLGSTYYVASLSAAEQAKIRAYLNFDMIASPNWVNQVYDGDGSAFNISGPVGSAEIEEFFENYFVEAGQNYSATEFNGRSDYGPFLDAGIASGGTTTGADEVKTPLEVEMYGGVAGEILDQCYHQACDNYANMAWGAFELHAKGIAASVAKYAASWAGFPEKPAGNSTMKRSAPKARDTGLHRHFGRGRKMPVSI